MVKILKSLIHHGADKTILVDAHPHIGTNKLPKIIENIRQTILDFGGEIHFNSKLVDIILVKEKMQAIDVINLETNQIQNYKTDYLLLATGHSARDIYQLLNDKNIAIETKPFAMGVRISIRRRL